MWSSYRVPKSEQMAKKSSTYQIVIKTPMGRSWRAWMNPFSLKMLRHQAWERRLWHVESKNRSRAKSRFGRPTVVVACLNDFCKNIKKKTVVVMDNSSIHRSEEFEEYMARWKKKGLIIKYLIPYAPELNLIEILWRHIKYLWLPFSAYQCMEALREALEHILKGFGSKYQITFA